MSNTIVASSFLQRVLQASSRVGTAPIATIARRDFSISPNRTDNVSNIVKGDEEERNTVVYTETTVHDILEEKKKHGTAKNFESISSNDSVFNAIQKMTELNLGSLLVTNGSGEGIVGIITERDYLKKVAVRGFTSKKMLVQDIMTKSPLFVYPEFAAKECLKIMTEKRVRHLPVCSKDDYLRILWGLEPDKKQIEKVSTPVNEDKPKKPVQASGAMIPAIGVVSIGDCVKHVILQQKFTIAKMREYTSGHTYSVQVASKLDGEPKTNKPL